MGKAAVEVLEAHGFTVITPPQRCCGIPRLGVGDLRGAREMGRRMQIRHLTGLKVLHPLQLLRDALP